MQTILKLLLTSLTLVSVNIHAMNINLLLSDDFKRHENKLNFSYDLCYKIGAPGPGPYSSVCETVNSHGIRYDAIEKYLDKINTMLANKHIDESFDLEKSQLTLGYKKDSTDVTPSGCRNIKFKEIMLVKLSEHECIVN